MQTVLSRVGLKKSTLSCDIVFFISVRYTYAFIIRKEQTVLNERKLLFAYQEMTGGGELKTLQFMMTSPPTITWYSWELFVRMRGAMSENGSREKRQQRFRREVKKAE